jgi:hypothetical protein
MKWEDNVNMDDCFVRLGPSRLKMEKVRFSETLVSTYESARRHTPEEHRHLHRRENLKSRINMDLSDVL